MKCSRHPRCCGTGSRKKGGFLRAWMLAALLLATVVLCAPPFAAAQTPVPVSAAVANPPLSSVIVEPFDTEPGVFSVLIDPDPSLIAERTLTGATVPVTFRLVLQKDVPVRVTDVVLNNDALKGQVTVEKDGEPRDDTRPDTLKKTGVPGAVKVRNCAFRFTIRPDADLRVFRFRLLFEPTTYGKNLKLFEMPVFTRESDQMRLKKITEKQDKNAADQELPLQMTVGVPYPYTLNLKNNYGEYGLTLRKLMLSSRPSGLIRETTFDEAALRKLLSTRPDPSLVPQDIASLRMTLDSGHIGLADYITAMWQDDGRPGQAVVYTVEYTDDYGRSYRQELASPLRIQPNYAQLFLGALFGAALGAVIIFFWRKLNLVKNDEFTRQMQQYDAWGSGKKIIYHAIAWVVPVIWFGILFLVGADFLFFKEKLRASHDNPVAGFVIGFLLGIIGPASFFKWVEKAGGSQEGGGG